jgi:hypothetical protein
VGDASDLLDEAAGVWAKSQVVWEGSSWDGPPAARALVERVAAQPDCHTGLVVLIDSPNQLVAAHALQALDLAGSPALADLSDEFCSRREKVTFQCGSFRNSMDLGGYARQLRKRARARVGRG